MEACKLQSETDKKTTNLIHQPMPRMD